MLPHIAVTGMNNLACCKIRTQTGDNTRRPASRWRRGGQIAGWLVPGATLVLLPKCPVCVAAYVALFSGVGISIAAAARLRTSLLVLCLTVLLWLVLKLLGRVVFRTRRSQWRKRNLRRQISRLTS
ncbi:MAG TPA: hypothetical protein VMJ12_01710 [Candidatus Acidoferrales bacterium]|nr:hypothetical protein [Candidatus Acidoferrales bacterium]